MDITLFDGLVITLISMFFVTVVLSLLMVIINLIHKFLPQKHKTLQDTGVERSKETPVQVVGNKEYEKVAVLTALALAGEENPNALFTVQSVRKIN